MTVTVQLPHGRLRRIWLPIPSLLLYLMAWGVRIALWFVPKRVLEKKTGQPLPIDVKHMGRALTRLAWIALCSGPYVMCDVSVPKEGVRVKVAFW
jgi:hypothetical protein